jgi:GTPase SAR1 family protein
MSSKKIILIGPSGTGKTSIKKTFFEKYSPISLLKNPLNPSRGINTSNYCILDSQLGVFDLAGQENDFWLSNANRSIFDDSNLIICIFDIHNSVESIIQFLLKIYQIQSELSLKSCQIIAFMHKIDLVSHSYAKNKMKTIHEFVTKQHPRGANFEIFRTSITKDHYYYTFRVLYILLRSIIQYERISIESNNIVELFSVLDEIENKNKTLEEIACKVDIKEDKISSYIIDMKKKGIIESIEGLNAFVLSDSFYYFKFGLENKRKKGGVEENLDFDIFFLFLILNELKA